MAAKFHRPELDALRFGAFLLVFLHHALPHAAGDYAGLPRFAAQLLAATARAGALGVDVFFALSSYLITVLLLRELHTTGSLDVRAFYLRRILRIWPLYFFALLALVPLLSLSDPRDALSGSYIAAYALLAGNWACAWGGYPASSFALLWSVSIEEQFYLAWPWLVRRHAQQIARCAWIMLAVATATRVLLAMNGTLHPGVWCNTLARLDPIAAGALLAYSLDGRVPRWPAGVRVALLASGLAGLLVVGALGAHDGWGAVWAYPVTSVAALAILWGVLGLNSSAGLGYLGRISFGLYVYHEAALRLSGNVWLGFLLTVLAAAVSHRFLETPFLRWKERFPGGKPKTLAASS